MFANMYAKIENTTICGGNCIMCPRNKFKYKFENMPFSIFKKAVDDLVAGGCRKVGVNGYGDPLCDNGMEEKLSYIRAVCPEMYVSTINTGHLFTDENIRMLCKYINIIKISMYGMTKQTYESIHRGSIVFEDVKEKIDKFLYEARKSSVYTIMTFLVLPENKHEMDEWISYYEPKCDRVDVWKPHNWGGHVNCLETPIVRKCNRVMVCNDIQICTDGSVVVCCFDFNRGTVIGNIQEQSLEEILHGEKLRELQKIHVENNLLDSEIVCKYCDQLRDRGDALVYSSDKALQVGKPSLMQYSKT